MHDDTYDAIQQSLLGSEDLRPAPRRDGGPGLLDDRATVARLRTTAPTRRHFCLQAGLEPGPVAYARVNAALLRFGLPLYPTSRHRAA
ncbi:MAG: hypothetical protein U0S36_04255 [Candidatus Nanopelagicales bacterium]|jgi:hypothetical protein